MKALTFHNPVGKAIYLSLFFGLLIAFLTVSLLLYWALQPDQILQIKRLPVPVTKNNIKSGDLLYLKFDFCKYDNTYGVVERQLVSDKIVILLPTYIDTLKKSCAKNFIVPVQLPYLNRSDSYYLHYKVTYKINPIKVNVVEFDTEDFKIAP